MADVARDFERDAGSPPPPVAVIVHDVGDPAWPIGAEGLLVAAVRAKATMAPPKADGPADPDESLRDALNDAEEAGVTVDVLIGIMPLLCDQTTLRDGLGAPAELAERVPVALVLPTKALVRQSASKMLKGALEKEGIGVLAQVALAPLLAIVEAKMTTVLSQVRNLAVYEYWAYTNAKWTDEEKKSHIDAYTQRTLSKGLGGLPLSAGMGRENEQTDVENVEDFDVKRESEEQDVGATIQPTTDDQQPAAAN